ncbi:hypothetical protein LJC20_00055 [Eubacteriales bacterium OttesenSCG-928-M02]|nr:hypothetical protein [Eubacteriales bacterium OttesenSCG-928-M02]
MNEYIKMMIEVRRKAIVDAYCIEDADILEELAAMLLKMEELGEGCADAAAFEAAFAASPLYTQYTNFCARVAGQFPLRQNPHQETTVDERNILLDDMDTLGRRIYDDVTYTARREAYETSREAVESMPVVGDVAQASRTASVLQKWFKKK